ncbi:type I 3-dehydroquinate dehydratase [Fibrobacter sp.]|uniref:type I 3-dehydroquinate dehydratase n=1 Tax=Fibrobacter sp. TaxID=35828 RepID=UPI0025C3F432|nr:type I 3-dehydroquinate dehydratase [Fibrobacter sp.]MBR3070754.1 type I 3-dehydroquinate dehydratase [Fibrobacter sp.]
MPTDSPKYLVGLVDPETLTAAESEELHPSRIDYENCDILEIRYDFFDESEWLGLSGRVRKIAPKAIQLGTIRLKRDGGTFPDARAIERTALWQKILNAADIPEWLDLERDYLHDFNELRELAEPKGVKILVSEHNFTRIPGDLELKNYLTDVKRIKADGIKIAAMSNTDEDCTRLYKFAKKAKGFKLIAAFGMGETGKISRIWSLKEGANLTYGSIGKAAAPGQIDVALMRKAIDKLEITTSQIELSSFLNIF